MAKTSIFNWFSYPLPVGERFRLIRGAGFDATSLWWGDEDRQSQPDMARNLGLEIDNVHIPFPNPNDLWQDSLGGEDYYNLLASGVSDCARHGIPVAVVHVTRFSEVTDITPKGIDRVKKLCELAEDKGVYLAVENLIHLQHLDAIFETVKSDHLGFCYDSGHEHCSRFYTGCLEKYGDRLFAVHLDDNFGDLDTHLLPYDGTLDWDRLKMQLKRCRAIQYLTLEVDFNPQHEKGRIYQGLSAEEFLSRAYQRMLRLMQPD